MDHDKAPNVGSTEKGNDSQRILPSLPKRSTVDHDKAPNVGSTEKCNDISVPSCRSPKAAPFSGLYLGTQHQNAFARGCLQTLAPLPRVLVQSSRPPPSGADRKRTPCLTVERDPAFE